MPFSFSIRRSEQIRSFFRRLLAPVRDLLFLSTCHHCTAPLTDDECQICEHCWSSLVPVRPGDHTLTVLMDRFREGGAVDEAFFLCYFQKGGLLQSLVHGLKYREMTTFGEELGRRLGRMLTASSIDVILPVPLNPKKQRERGYNQSECIARGIAAVTGARISVTEVRRTRYTQTQTHLDAEQRKENVSGVFAVTNTAPFAGRRVLIVDDIITTGSTIQELARTVKEAGASAVIVGSAGLAKLGFDA